MSITPYIKNRYYATLQRTRHRTVIMELFRQEGYIYTNGEEPHKEVNDILLRDDMSFKYDK